jgi:hypothetical protein
MFARLMGCHCPKVRSTDDDRIQVGENSGITPGADLVNPLIWLSATFKVKRELLGIASSGVPGLSQRAKRTGDRHNADAILTCILAKIEAMPFSAPCSLPEFSSSTPTEAAAEACGRGGADL